MPMRGRSEAGGSTLAKAMVFDEVPKYWRDKFISELQVTSKDVQKEVYCQNKFLT